MQAFRVAVHPRVLPLLVGPGGERLQAIEAAARRRFFLVPAAEDGHVHLDHFELLEQGKLESLRPGGPVEEGAAVELKLVEVGLHDASAGVGKLDGWDVVVADAAKLVGKKVTATVGRVLDGIAYATLAEDAAAPEPITFEAEAEKPTRAPSRKKTAPAAPSTARRKKAAEAEALEPPAVSEAAEAGPEEEPEAVAEAEEQPKKRRTRRGTRGGRGRKKTTPASAASAEATPGATTETDGRKRAPRIHVPPSDLTVALEGSPTPEDAGAESVSETESDAEVPADGLPKRKRARRGTRGGRGRRKPKGSTNGEADEAAETTTVAESEEPAEYVPMSEWIEDFERPARPAR